MLTLSLHVATQHYAIPAKQVVEVLPLTALSKIPQAPVYIAGLLDYRGSPVPVIDLCALISGSNHKKVLTTRVVLVRYQSQGDNAKLLALIAERVTETLAIADHDLKASGIRLKHAAYLGPVTQQHGDTVQLINADSLLTDEVREMLFEEPVFTNSQTA